MSDNIWRDEFMHHRLASEAEARERKQSDTPETDGFYWKATGIAPVGRSSSEWADFARKLERERDEYKQLLADTLKSDAPLVERLKLELEQLRRAADELRVNGLLGNSDRAVSAVESYNKLPHVIERKDPR